MALFAAYPIANGLAPSLDDGKQPMAMRLNLDFGLGGQASQEIDLFKEQSAGVLEMVQTIHVYNVDNAAVFNVEALGGAGMPLQIGIGRQALLPVYVAGEAKFRFSTTLAAGLIVRVALINVPMPFLVW